METIIRRQLKKKVIKDNVVNMPKSRHPKHNATSFKPGVAPNPGGRAKVPVEFKDLMKEYSVDAAHQIKWLMQNGDEKTQLNAAMYIIDRAYGKPMQANEISGPGGSPLTPPSLIVNFLTQNNTTIDGETV